MTASKWFNDVAPQVLQGVDATYREAFNAMIEAAGNMEGPDVTFVQVAYAHKPDPITPQDFIVRAPYANPANFKVNMAASAERGWLQAVGEGQYTVSDKGAEAVERLLEALNAGAASIESLPDAKLERIHDLLQKVVKKAHKLPEPANIIKAVVSSRERGTCPFSRASRSRLAVGSSVFS